MKITVYSSKGSAGKTPISANIAFDRGYALGTNEPFNVLEDVFDDDQVMSIAADDEFPELPPEIDIVFDLAGSISRHAHSITSAIRQSDLVVVPVYNDFKSRKSAIGTILEIEPLTRSILIVATKLQAQKGEFIKDWRKSRDFLQIEQDIRANIETTYPILPLKLSKGFDTIFDREMSLKRITETDPLLAHSFRDVTRQFDAIYAHIDQVSS
jgi:cellulose biosynthesis protein BcsQ